MNLLLGSMAMQDTEVIVFEGQAIRPHHVRRIVTAQMHELAGDCPGDLVYDVRADSCLEPTRGRLVAYQTKQGNFVFVRTSNQTGCDHFHGHHRQSVTRLELFIACRPAANPAQAQIVSTALSWGISTQLNGHF